MLKVQKGTKPAQIPRVSYTPHLSWKLAKKSI
jgi:hypothetical protein